MSLTLQEQKKKEYAKFAEEIKDLQGLSEMELDAEHVSVKTQYEHKKNLLSFFFVTIILMVFTSAWEKFADVISQLLNLAANGQGDEAELAKIGMMISDIIIVNVTFLIIFILLSNINDLRFLHRRLQMIEVTQNKYSKREMQK